MAFVLMVGAWGCHRTLDDEDATSESDGSGNGPEGGEECPPGRTFCDPGCPDLQSDRLHCGECKNVCQGDVCKDGMCQPDWAGCLETEEQWSTCDEICASAHSTCEVDTCHWKYTAGFFETEDCIGLPKDGVQGCDVELPLGTYVECCCTFD